MDRAAWQAVLDMDFPHGLLMTWRGRTGPTDPMYRIPRADVITMSGVRPVVRLDVWDTEKSFIVEIVDYTITEQAPRRARVAGAGYTETMYWSANISDELKQAMRS